MSVPIRVSSKLPDTYDSNGLLEMISRFVRADEPVLAIVRLDTVRLTTRVEDGLVVPTIEIREAEPEGKHLPSETLRDLLERARDDRTRVATLPYADEGEVPEL